MEIVPANTELSFTEITDEPILKHPIGTQSYSTWDRFMLHGASRSTWLVLDTISYVMAFASYIMLFSLIVSSVSHSQTATVDKAVRKYSCSDEARLRSKSDKTPVTFRIRNIGPNPVSVYWLDYQGKRVSYGSIEAKSEITLDTFLSHPWVISSKDVLTKVERCDKIFLPLKKHADVTVNQPLPNAHQQPAQPAPALSLIEVCRRSLNYAKTDWSTEASAVEARREADTLGITVNECRLKLGVTQAQTTVVDGSSSNSQSEVASDTTPTADLFQKKLALVIGNSAYEHSPVLANPHNDAEAVAKTLTGLGFEVISGLDLTNAETEKKAREFAKAAKTADVSLLYYAGHGLQIAGENYIVPVDAKVEDETAISFELINVSTITNFMGGLDKVGIILLDACRDNPFSRSLKRSLSASRAASVDQGLAPISAEGGGLFVAFATAPGDVAADGEGMTNSPFTTALLKHLPTKGLEINTVMTRVKAEVAKMTKNDQRPWTNSDLTTEVYLAPAN